MKRPGRSENNSSRRDEAAERASNLESELQALRERLEQQGAG